MSEHRIEVAPAIWQWVLSSVILSEENLATLNEWMNDKKRPTFNQLEAFSKKTRIPIGYFFLETPPKDEFKLLEYRTVNSTTTQIPSRDLIDTVNQMENAQEWMRDYLISIGADKIDYVGSVSLNNDIVTVAASVRERLRLDYNWFEMSSSIDDSFKILREAIGKAGVLIMMNGIVGNNTRRSLNVEEFRAFTLIDEFAPLIFINATDSMSGKVFSLIHEFVHIGIAQNSLYNASLDEFQVVSPVESFCNAVTVEIIAPLDIFKEKW